MGRPLRFSDPQALHHVTLRCNDREFLFEEPWFVGSRRFVLRMEARFALAGADRSLRRVDLSGGLVRVESRRGHVWRRV